MRKLYLILIALSAILACSISNTEITRSEFAQARIKQTKQISTPPLAKCQVKTGFDTGALNLRAGPDVSFESMAILREGDPIVLLEKPADNGWLYVEVHSLRGWVNLNFVECTR